MQRARRLQTFDQFGEGVRVAVYQFQRGAGLGVGLGQLPTNAASSPGEYDTTSAIIECFMHFTPP